LLLISKYNNFFCPPPTPAHPPLAVGQQADNDEPKYFSNLEGVRNIRQDILFVESTIDEVLRWKCKASF